MEVSPVKATAHFNQAHQLLIEPFKDHSHHQVAKAMQECHQGLQVIPEGFPWGKHEEVYDELLVFLGEYPKNLPNAEHFTLKARRLTPENRAAFVTLVRRAALILSYSNHKYYS